MAPRPGEGLVTRGCADGDDNDHDRRTVARLWLTRLRRIAANALMALACGLIALAERLDPAPMRDGAGARIGAAVEVAIETDAMRDRYDAGETQQGVTR